MKQIIEILIEQHRSLRKITEGIDSLVKEEGVDGGLVVTSLNVFEKELKIHLDLENNVFYVRILEDMRKQGRETKDTEKFIAQMMDIGKAVYAFLEKYDSAAKIISSLESFSKDFSAMREAYYLRMESEEAGVYLYWQEEK